MKLSCSLGVVAFVAVLCLAGAVFENDVRSVVSYEGHQVLRFGVPSSSGAERAKLMSWLDADNLDMWGVHPEWVDVRLNKSSQARVADLGLPFHVMIEDLEADLVAERASIAAVRANANADFIDTYRTYEEYNDYLDQLAKSYPHLVTKKTIGKTVEGRAINGIVITAPNDKSKVSVVFNGGQHAREWIGPITNAYIAHKLVSLYGKDAQVTKFLEEIQWSIFPVINADGYTYSWSTDRMWRKNRRQDKDSDCIGVDNNRNWGFHWGEGGASTDPCDETYRGLSAFSEPENLALANYLADQPNLHGYVDWHSYSQIILGPWGWTMTAPKDIDTQNEQSKPPSLYVASGGSNDYVYGVLGTIYAYTIELRDTGRYGFILPASEIIPTGEESFAAVRVFADYILAHPEKNQ